MFKIQTINLLVILCLSIITGTTHAEISCEGKYHWELICSPAKCGVPKTCRWLCVTPMASTDEANIDKNINDNELLEIQALELKVMTMCKLN